MLDHITPLFSPLAALQNLLSRFDDRGIIIGGIAASLLGTPRLTADLDAMLLLSFDELPQLMQAAKDEGLVPRIQDAEGFARNHRVLLLCHVESGTNIDISLGVLPFEEEAVERSIVYQVSSLRLRLPTPEDLIIFKAVGHRPKDLLDIQAIIQNNLILDHKRIESWVIQFADALEMPELWQDIRGFFR